MIKVEMTEVSSRLGCFSVIKVGQTILVSQCDTRTKILAALSMGPLTSEQLVRKVRVSYSCVMDHMEFFERLGLVRAIGKRSHEGRRRIYYHLNENPLEAIEELFLATKTSRVRQGSSPLKTVTV
jgi:predicted ArsR family transcriptional regulator